MATCIVRCLLLMLLASPSYASDWDEYAIVCEVAGNISVFSKDGVQNKIVPQGNHNHFVLKVNEMMQNGWQPLGGISSGLVICQSMGKE